MGSCYFCKAEIPFATVIGYASLCNQCGKPLKICLNCQYYDPNAYHQCLEHIDEPVVQKDLPNYCDYFVLKKGSGQKSSEAQQEARSRFFSLFGDDDS